MAQACIRIGLPDGEWKADVSRENPNSVFHIMNTMMRESCAVETVVIPEHTDGCLSDIEVHPDVEQFAVIEQHRNRTVVQLETFKPAALSSASQAGTPFMYPVDVHAGELTATIIGTHAAISSLGEQLQTDGLCFEVVFIQTSHDVNQVLTDRQKEVLFTAVEHGYYQNPRQCTLTDIADILGIAKSTCSGTLQRTEAAIVEYFCSQHHLSVERSRERRTAVGERPD